MNKYFVFLLLVFSLPVSLGLIASAAAHTNRPAANSYGILTLSYREVFIPCKIGYVPTESCPDRTSILVAVSGARHPDGKESEISHKVSGGRFVRKGEYFEWDFSGVEKPGVYSITVDFVDFNGKKLTATEYVTLRECDCPNDVYAPASAALNTTPTPSAKIEKVELGREEIFIPCPPGRQPAAETTGDRVSTIRVKTSVVNPQNDALTYHYTVSGGRIVGQGESVSWDLSGVSAGTYTIAVGVRNGENISSETQTKTIRVKETDCAFTDVCPALDVETSSDSVKAAETVTFTAKVSDGFTTEIRYDWTVSAGEIVEGQGTPKIKVRTTREMAGSGLTATVQINSQRIAPICSTTDSETVSITK